MSTENNEKSAVAQATKKIRRGVSNATRATSRKKFDEKTDANPSNGLFVGFIESLEVRKGIAKDDSSLAWFAGVEVPSLHITFSNGTDPSTAKYYTKSFFVVPSNVDTIPGGKAAWQVDNIFRWLKHIYDVFVLKGKREMTEEEELMLGLDFEDFDDNGDYVSVDPAVVAASYDKVFTNFVALMNNNGNPYYGPTKKCWIKLLRFTKNKGEWSPVVGSKPSDSNYGDLGLPTFIGEGCLELYDNSKAPTIKVDPIKESIRFQQVAAKQPNLGAPAAPGAAPMGGVPNIPMGATTGGFGVDAGFNPAAPQNVGASDLPF